MNNEREEPQNVSRTAIMVFLLGAAVGATVAVLYAPASGELTRARIADKANDVKQKASEWTGKAVDQVGEWKDRVASGVHETFDRVAETIESASESVNYSHPKQRMQV